jgi:hypothetical protein
MIATSRKPSFPPTISRQFELSRLQDQRIACAYEMLIPSACRRLERTKLRRGAETTKRGAGPARTPAVGA